MPIKPGETVPLTETQRGYVSYLEQYIDRRLSGFKPEDYVVIFDICDSSRVPFTGMKVSQQTRNECDFPVIIRKNSRNSYLTSLEVADKGKSLVLMRFALNHYKETFRKFFETYFKYV